MRSSWIRWTLILSARSPYRKGDLDTDTQESTSEGEGRAGGGMPPKPRVQRSPLNHEEGARRGPEQSLLTALTNTGYSHSPTLPCGPRSAWASTFGFYLVGPPQFPEEGILVRWFPAVSLVSGTVPGM